MQSAYYLSICELHCSVNVWKNAHIYMHASMHANTPMYTAKESPLAAIYTVTFGGTSVHQLNAINHCNWIGYGLYHVSHGEGVGTQNPT